MNTYQFVFILKKDTEETLKKIAEHLQKEEGTISTSEKWGKKDCAYPIKKHTSGYYFEWHISIDQKKIITFKKKMDYDEDVLRYLLIKLKIKDKKP